MRVERSWAVLLASALLLASSSAGADEGEEGRAIRAEAVVGAPSDPGQEGRDTALQRLEANRAKAPAAAAQGLDRALSAVSAAGPAAGVGSSGAGRGGGSGASGTDAGLGAEASGGAAAGGGATGGGGHGRSGR